MGNYLWGSFIHGSVQYQYADKVLGTQVYSGGCPIGIYPIAYSVTAKVQ